MNSTSGTPNTPRNPALSEGQNGQFFTDEELCEEVIKQAIWTAQSTTDPVRFQIRLGKLVESAVDLLRHRS